MKVLTMLIYLLEATVYDPTIPGTTVLRYSSGTGYNQTANYYAPRIAEDKLVEYQVVLSADPNKPDPTVTGTGSGGAGAVTLKDEDQSIKKALANCGIAGFSFTLLFGDDQAAYGTFTTLMSGKLADPTFDPTTYTFNFQDRSVDLSGPLGQVTYAGNNALPAGTEGTAGDVGSTYKPVALGRVRQVQAPCVNTSRGVDQIHDGQISAIAAVRDKGVALTVGASRTFANIDSVTDPGAGNVDYFLGDSTHGAYGRRVAVPTPVSAGPFTYDIDGDAPAGVWKSTVADIVKQMVTARVAGGPSVSAGDVTALNAAAAGVVGFWNRDNVTVAQAIAALLPSANAKWWLDGTGTFRMVQLAAPSGSPVANIRRFDLSVARSTIDADLLSNWQQLTPDVPVIWKVTVQYQRFWTVQTQGLDANISQALRAQLQNEWRSAVASDSSVLTQFPGAAEITVNTMLDSATDAANLASSILGLFKVRRDTLQVDCECSEAVAAVMTLGSVVKVFDVMDYGTTGRLMTVLGLSLYDHRAGLLRNVKLWG